MEEIIRRIIDLDNKAIERVNEIKSKEDNIEIYINEKLKIEKQKVDNKFLYKKKKIQEKFDTLFDKSKIELDRSKDEQIRKIEEKYQQDKNKILENLLNSIIQRG